MTVDYAKRARSLVGTRFRPQGRTPTLGLDCVGLVLCTFGLPVDSVRRDYRLRGDHRRELMIELGNIFRRIPSKQRRPGDILMFQVATDQVHMGVLTENGFVHADARIAKVVETPGTPAWPIAAVFRRRVRGQRRG